MKSRLAIAVLCRLPSWAWGCRLPRRRRSKPPTKLPATHVQDLHYGDVLFHFYIGEDFEALTRLDAYSHWHRMPHHQAEAELLAGGLYLQLGMHNEAGAASRRCCRPEFPPA